MQIDVTTPIFQIDGTTQLVQDKEPITLRTILVNACLSVSAPAPGSAPADSAESYRRYKLAKLFTTIDQPEVKADDVVFLQKLVAATYTPLVIGQVFDLLDA